ncbi:MAG: helix-turn-helix transcriptional regulator [Anaerolineae bacterium]|nr:helix-turn-helix transcriptional regulator [Anaerolineae bacterium]
MFQDVTGIMIQNRDNHRPMTTPRTLGQYISYLMQKHGYNNSTLAAAAGISEAGVRNLLKHGLDSQAKDPDPRTLDRVATALEVNTEYLFRLAGYLPPADDANSVIAEYLADVFDSLSPEKQDAVYGVFEALAEQTRVKANVQLLRESPHKALEGMDLAVPGVIRETANRLIADYRMYSALDVDLIEPDKMVLGNKWMDLPLSTRRRILGLIKAKLNLDYDPTLVSPEWRE